MQEAQANATSQEVVVEELLKSEVTYEAKFVLVRI